LWWAKSSATIDAGNNNKCVLSAGGYISKASFLTIGKRYRAVYTTANISGASVRVGDGTAYHSATTTNKTETVEFVATGTSFSITAVGGTSDLDDVYLYPLGLVLAPEQDAPGNGFQLKDMSGNKNDITLPDSGVAWALPDRRPNSVRQTFTWAAANDAKYFLSVSHPLPAGAALRDISLLSSASTTATTISTATTLTRWLGNTALTNDVKKLLAPANRVPLASAVNDRNAYIVPNGSAFTGTITAELFYDITEGTP
jgi:hypothetical protein